MKYELTHHGILGMKWGVRRYQNTDGTLTEAGKKRYGLITNTAIKNKRKETLDAHSEAVQAEKERFKYALDAYTEGRIRGLSKFDLAVLTEDDKKYSELNKKVVDFYNKYYQLDAEKQEMIREQGKQATQIMIATPLIASIVIGVGAGLFERYN
ncbi:MAG: hypothetical protein IJ716_14350 [Lachnospiraceae bacterium]|nr:hypothetical protein [Lachnospiraceae bacterium]